MMVIFFIFNIFHINIMMRARVTEGTTNKREYVEGI
jgi:hypothetical protein